MIEIKVTPRGSVEGICQGNSLREIDGKRVFREIGWRKEIDQKAAVVLLSF